MRQWLTREEQDKFNMFYDAHVYYPAHVHIMFAYGRYTEEFDIIRLIAASKSYNNLEYRTATSNRWEYTTTTQYVSYTLEQLLEMIPSTIYCDSNFNAIDKEKANNYNTFKFYFNKNTDKSDGVNSKFCMGYKVQGNKGIHKRIIVDHTNIKLPELWSDEPIEMLFNLFCWLSAHGHLPKPGKKDLKKIIQRGH